ncbi:RNA polymerase sigma-70 factor (ECF subfamily) [Actinocrispum wychmicini]|uniref:RNA polymerase sigma-70 factor (ECF subfamily) n=1 Tax=Actinocrispum wychmicini TaxID=1213861 RepID=A0A4R2JPN9_9PSEU|nr:RNA polymerase sigma-70 factor (ECF subfamily) [Actinocrispum wychmicini]
MVDDDSSDVDLVAAAATGQVAALRLLHRRHAPWLRARLARRCANGDVVDDAIQDTFVAVWRGAGRFDPGAGEVAAWIWTIGVRRLISSLRTSRAAHEELDEAHAITESAEDRVLLGVEHGDLGAAMGSLSPELRAVIQATVLDGLTTREAARLLGIPEGTVKTRAMRARAKLRRALA